MMKGTTGENRSSDDPSATGGRYCQQCGAENHLESEYCINCGFSLGPAPEERARVEQPGSVTAARFLTPLVGLVVGLVFALLLLQATRLSAPVGEGAASQVVLFWPAATGVESSLSGRSAPSLVWPRLPITLEAMIIGGGLAVLLAWGLGLGLRRRHPGITAARMSAAFLAAVPMLWLGLLVTMVMLRYFDWFPPVGDHALWDDPKNNLLQLFWPVAVVGTIGGLWTALEMRGRDDSAAAVVLARALGLVLRHGGMLLSGVILFEILFGIPGLGRILFQSALARDAATLGASAAVFVWLALLSRFLGNLLLAGVDRHTPALSEDTKRTESGVTLAIGAGVTTGLLALLFLAPIAAPQDPMTTDVRNTRSGPSGDHWLGTDQVGRDVFSRVLHGGRSTAQISLPMALLALLVGVPMVVARLALDRARVPALVHGIEGVLEGLIAVPWLVIGIVIQVKMGAGWPFVALTAVLVPRALRVGWALGAGERLQAVHVASAALRLGALFLAAALAMSTALGFLGLGLQPPRADLGSMLAVGGAQMMAAAPWLVIFPGLVLSLVTATWLAVATLFSRSGHEYRPVGWVHTMS